MESDAIVQELAHRQERWNLLLQRGGPKEVSPDILRDMGIYGGAQGIWVDRARTGKLAENGNGVTVSLIHSGKSHPDDWSEDGVIYHYPDTYRPSGRDVSEIEATKDAGRLGLPVFVITPTTHSKRDVYFGWITGWSDLSKQFLVQPPQNSQIDFLIPKTELKIVRLPPNTCIVEKLLKGNINLDTLHWREFEELVAELLTQDGYTVELGPGQKDGGKDIVAIKEIEDIGLIMSIWQAKKLKKGNKVDIDVIRKLADTCSEQKASKGIVVTTTFLTKDALYRIDRDKYTLSKVDRDDLIKWIARITRNW